MASYILVKTTQPPYSSSAAIDAIEAALAATNIGLNVKYLFINDGVYQLLNNQNSELIAHKNTSKKLSALPLFDVEDIYVCAQSATQRNIDMLTQDLVKALSVESLNAKQIFNLANNAKQILVF